MGADNATEALIGFVEFCEERVITSEPSLFDYEYRTELEATLLGFRDIEQLSVRFSEVRPELRSLVEERPSWHTNYFQWQIVFSALADLYYRAENRDARRSARHDEEADLEEDEDYEDEEDAELGMASSQARLIIQSLGSRFSYVPDITLFILSLENWRFFAQIFITTRYAKSKTLVVWTRFKYLVRQFSSLLGLEGVLIGLSRLMAKSKLMETVVRIIGTALFIATMLFFFLFPLYRIATSPDRLVRWLVNNLGIRVPGGIDEE